MDLESLPTVVFLLLPGFLSWGIFCWGTLSRKLSQLEHLFISLLLSVLAFSLAYYLTYLIKFAAVNIFGASVGIELFPEYMQILAEPKTLPLELGIAVYLVAIGLGFLLIRGYRNKKIGGLFSQIGLDLHVHEDTWYRLFHEADYVTVHLRDGNIVSGWPTYFSQTGSKEGAELYLTKVHYYQKEKERWVSPSRSVQGLLINTDEISHIEFRKPVAEIKENTTATHGSGLPVVLSRTDFLRMGILFYSFGLILIGIQDWISAYSIAGLVFIFLSLIFMLAGLCTKPRNAINSFIERQENPIIKSFPKFLEWYILLILFAVGIAYSLGRLVQVNVPCIIGLYSIGFIWMFVSLIQLRLSLHQKRSDKDR